MTNKGTKNIKEEQVRDLLDGFLRFGLGTATPEQGEHLDGDAITAFIEGNLSEREALPMTSHLVDCSFCRHRTAELLRLDLEFADEQGEVKADPSEPTRVSDVISGIIGRLFGTSEGAVFAHEEKESEEDPDRSEEE